jgi:hypothetical protein
MFYYADLSGDTWVVRLNYVVHEVGKNGWAQLRAIRFEHQDSSGVHMKDLEESKMRDSPWFFVRGRSRGGTYLIHIPMVERGVRLSLIPSDTILSLSELPFANPVFHGV